MTYQLHRVEDLDTSSTGQQLSDYPDFDTALQARDRDVIAQLTERPSPPREITHLIIGPGRHGSRTKHPIVTFAGAEVDDPDPAAEIAATQTWLHAVRGNE